MWNALSLVLMLLGTAIFVPVPIGRDPVVRAADSMDLLFSRLDQYLGTSFFAPRTRSLLVLLLSLGGYVMWFSWFTVRILHNQPPLGILLISTAWVVTIGFLCHRLTSISHSAHRIGSLGSLSVHLCLLIAFLGSLPLFLVLGSAYLLTRLWKAAICKPVIFAIVGYLLFEGGLFLFILKNP